MKNGTIEKIIDNTIVLSDGSEYEIDTIVMCSGYQFAFPFLTKNNDKLITLTHRNKNIETLYNKIFCANDPDLMFVGLIDETVFALFISER
jgi:trimethylamine monooxygenase